MEGNSEKDKEKKKKFREGQQKQVLDTLFFDFIDLAKELQPKVVIAENVKGLLLGNAKEYVIKIYKAFDEAGYYCQHWLLDASKMGVPQRRERVFFIALRKDLAEPFMAQKDIFTFAPDLKLEFKEAEILFEEIEEKNGIGVRRGFDSIFKMWLNTKIGETMIRKSGATAVSHFKINPKKVLPTIIAHTGGSGGYHYEQFRSMSKIEFLHAGSFPIDYNFLELDVQYLIGMSVPPVVMAQIASRIYEQWLQYLK